MMDQILKKKIKGKRNHFLFFVGEAISFAGRGDGGFFSGYKENGEENGVDQMGTNERLAITLASKRNIDIKKLSKTR